MAAASNEHDVPVLETPLLTAVGSNEAHADSPKAKADHHNVESNLVTMESKTWLEEASILLSYSVPVALSSAARTLHDMTDQFILGHLGTEYMAASGVATIWTLLFDGVILECVMQLSMLCSQAYGAGNYRLVGEWLQLGLCFFTMLCVPVILARLFTTSVLEFAGFDSHLAELAGQYTQYAQMSILFDAIYFSCRSYMSAQGIVRPAMIIDNIAVLVNLVVAYSMVFPMGLGFIGAALATTIVRAIRTAMYILYCFKYKRYHELTWYGWSAKALTQPSRWRSLLGLVLPAAWGTFTEQIQFQLQSFMAAKMGVVVIAAHNLSLATVEVFFLVGAGVGEAVGVRVGAAISTYRVKSAKKTVNVAIGITTVFGTSCGVLYWLLAPLMARMASADPAVHYTMLQLAPYGAVCIAVLTTLNPAFQILLSQGRAAIPSNLISACSWLIGFPISYFYGFLNGGGVVGLWTGLLCGYCTATVALVIVVYRSNWTQICHDARVRAEVPVSHRSRDY